MPDFKLPADFSQRMKDTLGEAEFQDFYEALQLEPAVSVRLNPFKLSNLPLSARHVAWAEQGFFLEDRPSFTLDPLFHAGAYYVQESSSMFIDHILRSQRVPNDGLFLDLSAAPGGKSTLLSSYLGEEGFLVANEVIKSRASILKENIIKWGIGNTLVTHNDPEHFKDLEGIFDLVLIDAPCSGEGMFRKDPASMREWSQDNIALCALRQQRIMDHAAGLVKGGGYLVYSTCTYNEQENEEIVKFITEEFSYQPVRIPLETQWGIEEVRIESSEETFYGYRFFPHKVPGEGFFVTVFKRPDHAYIGSIRRMKDFKHPHLKQVSSTYAQQLRSLISLPEQSVFYALQDSYFFLRKQHQLYFEYLSKYLSIKYFGIELGKINKNQWIPSHEWAVSILPKEGFPLKELDLSSARDFLRKEESTLGEIPEGWIVMQYQGLSLGLLKNLGNRTNNYYPKEWRIKNL
ncbi:methyltransferase RsmF C-terminal domain-like protein [Mongoliitalea daihaiensis]|uniref:methyltransferase RsmF C-terminal domain-like protein n=1 Tax=Mongoliitalea daihaiensis TaxID=2782006 RepID=UPI001F2DB8C5|nr:tRNA/rRNA cytosine-C5-methylase [Mongoliitalea daihaiensis]UJP65793.1 tRNA/rRNA cytosine-C5-methylase [Mongoliitalea daihaiensis]